MEGFLGFVLIASAGLVYLGPAIVAGLRRHPQRSAILVLNLLLGWTLLGWVAALVWAWTAVPVAAVGMGPSPAGEDDRRPSACDRI